MNNILTWVGIIFCVSQSAMFSGLNLAFFSLTRLRLEIEVEAAENNAANKVLSMRNDSNFLLATILWGNVGINVLLTLLSDSVMMGLTSFLFSTIVITIFGEILPQAYFSRNALKMASALAPILRFYQFILYPVAKPCGVLLDKWLGKESSQFLTEDVITLFIQKHVEDTGSEIDRIEGTGAINFLHLDDLPVSGEGEVITPSSIIEVKTNHGDIVFPIAELAISDPFIQRINDCDEKWVIFVDEKNYPQAVLDADGFIRTLVSNTETKDIGLFCHHPVVIRDPSTDLATLLNMLRGDLDRNADVPIQHDIALLWSPDLKKIVTGADVLGKLLQGI
jgi:CBS domain containing-hemolysin-like protein